MDLLGIGPLEIIVVLIIILIVMGPKDIVKSSKIIGKFLRQVMTHPTFRLVQDTSKEIRNLPYRLAREAGVEDLKEELKEYSDLPSISPHSEDVFNANLGTWEAPSGDDSQAQGLEPPPESSSSVNDAPDAQSQPSSENPETQESNQGQSD